MSDANDQTTMDQMPVQLPAEPATAAQARARYFNSGNAFTRQLSPVPTAYFIREPALALDPATSTGLIPCDLSGALNCPFPATTPFMLARYARIRPYDRLTTRFVASGSLWYVIAGRGTTAGSGETIAWQPGDIFVLPGGDAHHHRAGPEGAVFWLVSNEPQLAFEEIKTVAPGVAPTRTPDCIGTPAPWALPLRPPRRGNRAYDGVAGRRKSSCESVCGPAARRDRPGNAAATRTADWHRAAHPIDRGFLRALVRGEPPQPACLEALQPGTAAAAAQSAGGRNRTDALRRASP